MGFFIFLFLKNKPSKNMRKKKYLGQIFSFNLQWALRGAMWDYGGGEIIWGFYKFPPP